MNIWNDFRETFANNTASVNALFGWPLVNYIIIIIIITIIIIIVIIINDIITICKVKRAY